MVYSCLINCSNNSDLFCRTVFNNNTMENNPHLRPNPYIVAFYIISSHKVMKSIFNYTENKFLCIQYFTFNATMFTTLSAQKTDEFWSTSEKRRPVRVLADLGTSHIAIKLFSQAA